MPGPPWQPAPPRYSPSMPIGRSRKPLGPGRFGPIRSGCSSPWQKSPAGAPNMVFMWYGAKVMWRIWMSLKLGAYLLILSTTRSRHLVFQVAVLVARGFHRERVGVRAGGVLAGRRHARVVHRRDLHAQRRVVRDDAAARVLPLPLLLLGGAEDADGRLHAGLVEEVVRRGEFGQPVEREVHLDERGAVVAALQPGGQLGR